MVDGPRRCGELLRVGTEVADVAGQRGGGVAEHGVGIGLRGRGDGVGLLHECLPPLQHSSQHEGREEARQKPRARDQAVERFGPDIHQIEHKRRIEPAGEPGGSLGAFERRQAREEDVGAFQLARRDRLVRQPLEGAAEVAVAADPGQRDILLIGPHRHEPHGEALVFTDAEGGRANRLAAVAPGGRPPGDVVPPGCENAGKRPIAEGRRPFTRNVVERIDEPDGQGPGRNGLWGGARHGGSLAKPLPRAE